MSWTHCIQITTLLAHLEVNLTMDERRLVANTNSAFTFTVWGLHITDPLSFSRVCWIFLTTHVYIQNQDEFWSSGVGPGRSMSNPCSAMKPLRWPWLVTISQHHQPHRVVVTKKEWKRTMHATLSILDEGQYKTVINSANIRTVPVYI